MNEANLNKKLKDIPASKKKNRLKKIFIGIGILLCGIVIGVGSTIFLGKRIVVASMQDPVRTENRILKRLQRNMDLTPDQAERLRAITHKRFQKVYQLRKDFQLKLLEQLDLLNVEGTAILDEKQQIKWDKKLARVRSWIPLKTITETQDDNQ